MKRKRTTILTALLVLIIQLGFVTDAFCYTKSINTPHRQQQTWYWCGAASAQMILECDTIAPPTPPNRRRATYPTGTITQIQQALYNNIQAHNNTTTPINWFTDPDGLQWTLDHYDMWQTYVQYKKSDSAWSCKKLAWTIENYEVPPAILINGGAHWIVVIGMDTSAVPTPTGTYKINSFTVHDPGYWPGALGANTKIGYNNFICDFNEVDTVAADPWDGLRVSVCDPDPVTPDLIVPPPLQEGPLIGAQGALEAAAAAIEQHHLWAEPGFEGALAGAEPLAPLLASWPPCGVGPCYCIPYAKMAEDKWLLTAVIVVYGVTGEFMEAGYALDEMAPELRDFYQELTYPCIARESSARPGMATPAATIMATPITLPTPPPPPIKINFQPTDSVVPYGCLADTGEPFGDRGNGYSYGWNAPNYETRDRGAHVDQRYDTLNHMQKPSNPHAVWEIALENGIYNVLLVCGDPSYQDQTNRLHPECKPLRDPDPWPGGDTAGSDFDVFEVTREVADGRLTIEPDEGAYNAKICYVKISPAPEAVCPEELIGVDIGEPEPPGSIDLCAGSCRWAITAGGTDIWGTADQFYYAYAHDPWTCSGDLVYGDFTAVVRVKSMGLGQNPHAWAKAGIMVRETLEPGSRHAMVVCTPENGVALQGRDVANGDSWHQPVGLADWRVDEVDTVWLRLDRVGNTITGSYAVGGETPPAVWTVSSSHETPLPPVVMLGLATTSHQQGVPIEVAYSDFCIEPYVGPAVLAQPELPDSPAGGDGYIAIQEVIDNGEIGDQGACYASLNSGGGNIAGHWKPVLNIQDSGGNGHYSNDDVFAVVELGYREHGSVDNLSLIARGAIRIPEDHGGKYTFGVNSDDGFTLQFPGQNFLIGENGEIMNFQDGAALRFYGGRGVADTLGMIALPPGEHPFWLTYHEGGVDAAVEFFAAKGIHTAFDPAIFRLVGHKSIGTVPVPGFCNEVTMAASRPGVWGQIDSIQDAMDAVAEGEAHGTNSVDLVAIVNHSDPDDGAADPDVSGSFPADLVFPNDRPGDDDDFGVMVAGLLDIPAAGTYQIGFNSDDGAGIQIFGHTWSSIVADATGNAVITGDVGDWLINDSLTGWSFTAGQIEFPHAGCYEFRAIMFERGGGSFFELFGRGKGSGGWDPTWHLLKTGGARVYEDPDGLQLVAPPVAECFPSTYPGYEDWLALGKPDCWCWPYQCAGDVDGATETVFNYRVYGEDLAAVVENWKKKIDDPTLNPCADIDHKAETVFNYQVYGKDLATVVTNWKKKDEELPGTCPTITPVTPCTKQQIGPGSVEGAPPAATLAEDPTMDFIVDHPFFEEICDVVYGDYEAIPPAVDIVQVELLHDAANYYFHIHMAGNAADLLGTGPASLSVFVDTDLNGDSDVLLTTTNKPELGIVTTPDLDAIETTFPLVINGNSVRMRVSRGRVGDHFDWVVSSGFSPRADAHYTTPLEGVFYVPEVDVAYPGPERTVLFARTLSVSNPACQVTGMGITWCPPVGKPPSNPPGRQNVPGSSCQGWMYERTQCGNLGYEWWCNCSSVENYSSSICAKWGSTAPCWVSGSYGKRVFKGSASGWIAYCPFAGGINSQDHPDLDYDGIPERIIHTIVDGGSDDDTDGKHDVMKHDYWFSTNLVTSCHLERVYGTTQEKQKCRPPHAPYTNFADVPGPYDIPITWP